jgi:Cu/Zn superoxide dismutase
MLQERKAVVTLYKGNEAVGDVFFFQEQVDGAVKVNGTVRGLSAGQHGFHVHEKGDVRDECLAAGPHFNPEHVSNLLQCPLGQRERESGPDELDSLSFKDFG